MSEFVTSNQIAEAAAAIRRYTEKNPTIGLILGSGLGGLADDIDQADIIPCAQIPHWPESTAPGHTGRVVIGQFEGSTVIALQGRVHFYEGYSIQMVTLPVRVMRALGMKTLIVTNAAGGMNPAYTPGDLMLIKNHINMPGMAGHNPLRGPNDDSAGPRFPDMTIPYDPDLRALAMEVAAQEGFTVHEGVYAFVAGPSFETTAELRFLQMVGGDAVGMSTVPSVIVARHAGIRVLGISTITNMALPDPRPGTHHKHEDVLATGRLAVPRLARLVHGVVARME
jgi:purine-nucleoside phosphorylase